jgi:hypothetical protein
MEQNQVTTQDYQVPDQPVSQPLPVQQPEAEVGGQDHGFPIIKTTVIGLLVVIVLGLLLVLLPLNNQIGIKDQLVDNRIFIDKVVLKKPGVILITSADQFNRPGFVIAASGTVLNAGTYSQFYLDLVALEERENYQPKSGDVLLGVLAEDQLVDPGSGEFIYLTDWLGNRVVNRFKVL